MKVKRIIVVGGGTAGWLSAGFLSSQLPGIEITVIHSKEVPIIGVGETTVPLVLAKPLFHSSVTI